MNPFFYWKNKLYCEGMKIKEVAEKVGTPFYLYSQEQIVKNYLEFDHAFAGYPHLICYALKANSNLSVARILLGLGAGLDIVSGGELYRALKAGFPAEKIVFAGVGKTEEEIAYALKENILMFNCESLGELELINTIARKMKKQAPIALRINPGIDPQTHRFIITGTEKNKFGLPLKQSIAVYTRAKSLSNVRILGMHCHIGSQIVTLKPFLETLSRLLGLLQELEKRGIKISYLNLGGGLGIKYKNENPPAAKDLAKGYFSLLKNNKKYTLILEPGRYILGNAGILVSKVLYLKESGKKKFVILDAGMTELIRPPLYDAYHRIIPLEKKKRNIITADLVGPICETTDYLALSRRIGAVKSGELLAIMDSGAYGFSMASTYNSRPRVAEVLVNGKDWEIIRQRETYADLLRGERGTKNG